MNPEVAIKYTSITLLLLVIYVKKSSKVRETFAASMVRSKALQGQQAWKCFISKLNQEYNHSASVIVVCHSTGERVDLRDTEGSIRCTLVFCPQINGACQVSFMRPNDNHRSKTFVDLETTYGEHVLWGLIRTSVLTYI